MAKKKKAKEAGQKHSGGKISSVEGGEAVEGFVVGFAEDLGKLLGHAQDKAESWLGQRAAVVTQLAGIRDTATSLLAQLGHSASGQMERIRRRGRAKKYAKPDSNPAGALTPQEKKKKKRRSMTAAGRAAISAAQKARWAAYRRNSVSK